MRECNNNHTKCVSPSKSRFLIDNLRRLWIEHVLWTRAFIISSVFHLPDLDDVTMRLLRNPCDFADILRPYYGKSSTNKFEMLFRDHLLIAAKLVNAAIAGDSKAVEEHRREWYANADDIAKFLECINPYWNKKVWQQLLYSHLKMTEDEAVLMLKEQYKASIVQYDQIQKEALEMADYMAEGIIKQFRV